MLSVSDMIETPNCNVNEHLYAANAKIDILDAGVVTIETLVVKNIITGKIQDSIHADTVG